MAKAKTRRKPKPEVPREEQAIPNPNLNKSSWQRWKRDVIARLGFQPKADGVTDEQHLFGELGVSREKAVSFYNAGWAPETFVNENVHYLAANKKNDDEPPRRYSQNVQDMNAYMLQHELGQLRIDFQCGPGPTVRQRLELREKDIHRELARRNALADNVLEREVERRDAIAKRPAKWNGMAPCGKHGADYEGQQCTLCPRPVVRLFDQESEVCTPLGQQVSMHVRQRVDDMIKWLLEQDPDASMRDFEYLVFSSLQMATARQVLLRRRH